MKTLPEAVTRADVQMSVPLIREAQKKRSNRISFSHLPKGIDKMVDTKTIIIIINLLHRKIQTISWRPREGAHLANKALATARTRVKFSLLYSSVSALLLWEKVMMAR